MPDRGLHQTKRLAWPSPKGWGEEKYSLLLMYIFNCFHSATGAVTNHLMKNHKQEWDAYCQMRARTNAKVMEAKEEKKESCEMENGEVRFYDVRSSKGRLPFLQKVGIFSYHYYYVSCLDASWSSWLVCLAGFEKENPEV